MAAVSMFLTVFLCLLAVIPLTVGIYVYRDAKKREMDAGLWALAAALIPVFIGFAIYLLVRQDSAQAEPGETVVYRKDRVLRGVLLMALAVPAAFLLLLVLLIVQFPGAGSGSSSAGEQKNSVSFMRGTSCTEEDMERYQEEQPRIGEWLAKCQEKDPDGIYVLCYEGESDGEKVSSWLVYRPSAGNRKKEEQTTKGTYQVISFEDTDDPRFDHAYFPLSYFSCGGSEYMYRELQIFVDGEQREYEMEQIDFDPAPR